MIVQLFPLIIPAVIAAFFLINLYLILGKRVGRQPGEVKVAAAAQGASQAATASLPFGWDFSGWPGLQDLKLKDPSFDPAAFLLMVRNIYESAVKAFGANDRQALRPLTTDLVFSTFDSAIDAREKSGLKENIQFSHPARADFDKFEVFEDRASIKVRFLTELTSEVVTESPDVLSPHPLSDTETQPMATEATVPKKRKTTKAALTNIKNKVQKDVAQKGEETAAKVLVSRRTAEIWTFERLFGKANAPWLLAYVEPAEI